jgi:thioredoxin:protein disulfide reductase
VVDADGGRSAPSEPAIWAKLRSVAPDAFTAALEKGPVAAALVALVGGLGVSLTPCVYPMIAVTVSVFGARQAKHRWEGALLSAAFVLGIITLFTPMGVAVGLTGKMFGSVLQNAWVLVAISALFLAMAASMFGAYDFALPSGLTNRLAQVGGLGYKGAFMLGLVCGLIAAPCSGPVLTGILAFIANTQSATLGAGAMSAFSLGLGAPFFVVGAFAVQLPKSGRWMVHIKSALGLVLVITALYFLGTAFPKLGAFARPTPTFYTVCVSLAGLGLLLGAVHREFSEPGIGVKLGKAAGIVLVSVAGFAIIAAFLKPTRFLAWQKKDVHTVQEMAKREGRPLLIDFTAAWCLACKELDKVTFAAPDVNVEAGRFLAVKVDATNQDDPKVESTLERFGVKGLPTVLVFDSRGKEAKRFTDFVPPERFLTEIKSVN